MVKLQQLGSIKMKKTREEVANFFKDESGSAALEYSLLLALIALVIIGAVTSLGTTLTGQFNSASTPITAAS
jgi:pilus assembly protein Flp/PilA